MNVIKEINAINQREISQNLAGEKWDVNSSWHAKYNDSAYVFVGGLPFDLTEGDAIVVFSQYATCVLRASTAPSAPSWMRADTARLSTAT